MAVTHKITPSLLGNYSKLIDEASFKPDTIHLFFLNTCSKETAIAMSLAILEFKLKFPLPFDLIVFELGCMGVHVGISAW
jgi:hypothetical protein